MSRAEKHGLFQCWNRKNCSGSLFSIQSVVYLLCYSIHALPVHHEGPKFWHSLTSLSAISKTTGQLYGHHEIHQSTLISGGAYIYINYTVKSIIVIQVIKPSTAFGLTALKRYNSDNITGRSVTVDPETHCVSTAVTQHAVTYWHKRWSLLSQFCFPVKYGFFNAFCTSFTYQDSISPCLNWMANVTLETILNETLEGLTKSLLSGIDSENTLKVRGLLFSDTTEKKCQSLFRVVYSLGASDTTLLVSHFK